MRGTTSTVVAHSSLQMTGSSFSSPKQKLHHSNILPFATRTRAVNGTSSSGIEFGYPSNTSKPLHDKIEGQIQNPLSKVGAVRCECYTFFSGIIYILKRFKTHPHHPGNSSLRRTSWAYGSPGLAAGMTVLPLEDTCLANFWCCTC